VIDAGKHNLIGVLVDGVDYDSAVERILGAARSRRPYGVTALAVHGLVEATRDPELRYRINHLELVTPDGQPVRWALNGLHDLGLGERCYGPTLMLRLCEAAVPADLPVFLYGSEAHVLEALAERLLESFPGLRIAGTAPSRFTTVSSSTLDEIAEAIRSSGAAITFVGIGCPRQEVFVYEMRHRLSMPVVAVGAAFEYHAGLTVEPPAWVQRAGLQWLWRLASDPRRLWRRYLSTNPAFVLGALRQRWSAPPDPHDAVAPTTDVGCA
jgi:N-acetylglucosaminyldiphosphoundecaprenol N-acetyl-beta-D-mannosaminyltransferase